MMTQEHRQSSVKRGLSLWFTVLTWATIGPAVALGLSFTAWFAWYSIQISFGEMLPVMVVGLFAMLICGVPGTLMWRWQFKTRILRPLRDLGS